MAEAMRPRQAAITLRTFCSKNGETIPIPLDQSQLHHVVSFTRSGEQATVADHFSEFAPDVGEKLGIQRRQTQEPDRILSVVWLSEDKKRELAQLFWEISPEYMDHVGDRNLITDAVNRLSRVQWSLRHGHFTITEK